MHFVMVRPFILRRVSPIPVARTPVFLSKGAILQALYASSCSGAITLVAIRRAAFAIVLDKSQDASLKRVIVFLGSFAFKPDGPWLPYVLSAVVLMRLILICSKIDRW